MTVDLDPTSATPLGVASASDKSSQAIVKQFMERVVWLLLSVLLGLSTASLVLAMAGWFRGPRAIVLGLTLGMLLFRVWRPSATAQQANGRRAAGAWGAACVIALASVAVNASLPAEHLLTGRDAATYANTAGWIASQGGLLVDARVPPVADPRLDISVPGFYELWAEGRLYPQFVHAFPALLAIGADLGGLSGMLRINPLIGGIALLMVFALGRRFMRPWLAVTVQLALASSLVFTYFARAPFSEVLALTFGFGGLWVLASGHGRGDRRTAIIGGLLLGAVTLARLDGLVLILPVTFYGLLLARSSDPAERAAGQWLRLGFLPPLVLALTDVGVFAAYYLAILKTPLIMIFVAYAGLIIGDRLFRGPAAPVIELLRKHRLAIANTLAVGVILAGLLAYFIRPVLFASTGAPYDLGPIQLREGLEIEATRTYAEQSLRWIGWYIGPVALVTGLLGWAIALRDVIRGRMAWAVPFLLTVGCLTLLYLWRPSINPDHIWAMRRFLTLTIPGWLLLAGAMLDRVLCVAATRGIRIRRALQMLGVLAALGLVVPAAAVTAPMATAPEFRGLANAFEEACEELGPNAAVVMVDQADGATRIQFTQAFRSFCDIPSAAARLDDPAQATALERMARQAHGPWRLYAVSVDRDAVTAVSPASPVPLLDVAVEVVEPTLSRPPRGTNSANITAWYAPLQP